MYDLNDIGVEKNNDDSRRNYLSSNRHDAPRETLVTEARLEQLSEFERTKRQYTKADDAYWNDGIYVKRSRSIL